MPCRLARPLLLLALALAPGGARAQLDTPVEAADGAAASLGADDECSPHRAGGEPEGGCGLSAMQRHGRRLTDVKLGEHSASDGASKKTRLQGRSASGQEPDGEADWELQSWEDPVEDELDDDAEDGSKRGEKADDDEGPAEEEGDAASGEEKAGEGSSSSEEGPEESAGEGKEADAGGANGTAAEEPEPAPTEPPTPPPTPAPPTPPPKIGAWQQCGGQGYHGLTDCIDGYVCWPESTYYYQCKPAAQAVKSWEPYSGSTELNTSSSAPLLTYYMYRAQGPTNYPVDNVNTASLGGLMWYVHNEVVSCAYGDCQYVRRFGINRIVRYKVKTRATQPLHDAGMNFGIRYAYDHGQCTGPWKCETQFEKYGYFVGCNNITSGFPFPDWPVYYDGVWYSLPGACSSHVWEKQSLICEEDQPGGVCKGDPTGTGTCTYSVSPAGEIYIDELEGIDDYLAFKEDGGQEFNKTLDVGVNMTFWNGINDTAKNAERVRKASDLFTRKYPNMPRDEDMATPPCDFDKARFFPDGLPTEPNAHTRKEPAEGLATAAR